MECKEADLLVDYQEFHSIPQWVADTLDSPQGEISSNFFLQLIFKLLECESTYEPEVIFKLGRVRIDLYQVTCLSVIHHIPDER